MESFDISHLKEADGKRVLQLFSKIEKEKRIIFESKNCIDAFIEQKQLYKEKARQKELVAQIKHMEKKVKHSSRVKKRYEKEIQEIDPEFVFEEEEEDEEDDDAKSSVKGDSESLPLSPAVTKEPLATSDIPASIKRSGSDGLHLQLKKTVLNGFGKLVRTNKTRPGGMSKGDREGDDNSGISDIDDYTTISDTLESDTPLSFMSDSGVRKNSPYLSGSVVDHDSLKELLQNYRSITAELESVRRKVDERKTDLETKFNAMQHLLHSQAQMLEYMDTRMGEMNNSLYEAVETGFRNMDERMQVLEEQVVTEVNMLGSEVRDSIVDHESVFQHIQDHEGRIKEIEDSIRSNRIDGTRYLSALTPLISAVSIVVINVAKASSKIASLGIGPQIQLAMVAVAVAMWLWYRV